MDYSDLDAVTWPYQLTNVVHREMYPLLEPSQPQLSAKGKTIIITGATGGVGKAIAEAWAIAGAKGIVLTGRKTEVLNEVATMLEKLGTGSTIVAQPAELTSEASVEQLWAKSNSELGRIDVLINDAGAMNYAPVGDIEPSDWWRDYEVNVKGVYLMSHHFLRQAGGNGTLITVSSGSAGSTFPNMSSYISSKLAQMKFMDFVHVENPSIRVFTLLPGLLKTAMTAEAYLPFARDDPMLSGGLSLFLCTHRAEWLRGGVMSVNWDIEEMEAHRDEIQAEGRNKLMFLNARLGKGGHPWKQ